MDSLGIDFSARVKHGTPATNIFHRRSRPDSKRQLVLGGIFLIVTLLFHWCASDFFY